MGKKVLKDDIIEKNPLKNLTDDLKIAKKEAKELEALLTKLKNVPSPRTSPTAGGKKPNVKTIQAHEMALRKSNETAKMKLKTDRLLTIEQEKINQLRKQENALLKNQVLANQKLTAQQQKEIGYLDKLALSNKKLNAQKKQVLATDKHAERKIRDLNKQIDRNNKVIRTTAG